MFSRVTPVFILCLIFSVAACKSRSVVNDAPATGNTAPASQQPTTQSAAVPVAQATPAASTPTPTPHPMLKEAMKNPGVPMAVPESLRRPATKDEMEMMMKQLPPEVRQRLMGMQAGQTPAPTPKKN